MSTQNDFLVAKLTKENIGLRKQIEELENMVNIRNHDILLRLESEETTLKKLKDLTHDYSQLEARYYNLSKKYDLLSNAKLGKLTLNYWKFKKRIPRDF